MSQGEALKRESITAEQHFTEPPPRFSEASLVKRMEELGIGRPSTYASILQVLKDRGYVRLDKRRMHAEDKGRVVTGFLESFFARYVEYDFTADLEEQLDRISNNEIEWKAVLRDFWTDFIGAVHEIKDLRVTEVLDALNELLGPHIFPAREDGGDPRKCPSCDTGRLSLKVGRFGAFIGCSNYPECRHTRQLAAGGDAAGDGGTKVLGQDPKTGLEVTLRTGRFGPYFQLGEAVEGEKPKRAGLPKNTSSDDITLEFALGLLSLPREVGIHPENGEPILAGVGRFGPYVQNEKTYANLEPGDDVLTIGLNRAVTLIAEKKLKPARGGRFGAQAGRSLGDHPAGGPVVAKSGRYGAYVSHNGVNATLPADIAPDQVTMEQAVELLAARAGKGGTKKVAAKKAKKTTKAKTVKKAAKKDTDDDASAGGKTTPAKSAAKKSKTSSARKTVGKKGANKTSSAKPKTDASGKVDAAE
jgi:DNA topoisomerase-1